MDTVTIDQLPDFLQKEFPNKGLNCIADIAHEAIVIQKDGKVVALFSESAFEDESVTDDMIRDNVSTWLMKN